MNNGKREERKHVPVMLTEVLEALAPRKNAKYVDGTYGDGGYSTAILNQTDCYVWAIDRDKSAVNEGHLRAGNYNGRLKILQGCFGDMRLLLQREDIGVVDGITLDLGLSSMQIEDPERGFSFNLDGPLDMRMGREDGVPSATDLINTADEKFLADIFWRLGNERHSKKIARAIVRHRSINPITRTGQLAELVRSTVNRAKDRIDPATRTFQAIRIHVNDELGELERGLKAAENILAANGRRVVVSFHSLEDRAVKRFFLSRSGKSESVSRHSPPLEVRNLPTFTLLGQSLIRPSNSEVKANREYMAM